MTGDGWTYPTFTNSTRDNTIVRGVDPDRVVHMEDQTLDRAHMDDQTCQVRVTGVGEM